MNKQFDVFGGSSLNAYDKYDLEKERQKKVEVNECDFIRVCEDIFQVKYRLRNMYVCTSLITNEEVWVQEESVKDVSQSFLEILREYDEILVRNDNGILIEGYIVAFIKKKKVLDKVVIKDVRDGEILVFACSNIKRVIRLKKERG